MSRLEKKLLHDAGRAIADFRMIEEGDRILVGVSGGKDSFTLLHLLQELQRSAPVKFSLIACNLDQGHPGFPAAQLEAFLRSRQVEVLMLRADTYSVVKRLVPEGKTACSVCSRLRRGILYGAAQARGCTKIALGHHRDDLIESLLLSMLFSGKMRSMPPKLIADDGRNTVIRPLCYAAEKDIAEFAAAEQFPIIPCDLCGSQENLQRKRVKRLLDELSREHAGVRSSLFAAMGNVMPAHLLDARLLLQCSAPAALRPSPGEAGLLRQCSAPAALRPAPGETGLLRQCSAPAALRPSPGETGLLQLRDERGPDPWIDGDSCASLTV